ncbi:MAG TPA: hypothetical protein VGD03_03265 [Frankiaceae bacterium]
MRRSLEALLAADPDAWQHWQAATADTRQRWTAYAARPASRAARDRRTTEVAGWVGRTRWVHPPRRGAGLGQALLGALDALTGGPGI